MNRDEIIALEPGLELDRLAGRFMVKHAGWVAYDGSKESSLTDGPVVLFEADWHDKCWKGEPFDFPPEISDKYDHQFKIWTPSTDVGQAWEVVEATRRMGYAFAMLDYKKAGYLCRFRKWLPERMLQYGPHIEAPGASPADAICRAALLVQLEEKDREP